MYALNTIYTSLLADNSRFYFTMVALSAVKINLVQWNLYQ